MKCDFYIISLEYPIQKLKYLKFFNIEPKVIKGINGSELLNRSFIPNSAFGCALSHQLAWKTFLQSNEEYAVIFEDDVILENNFIKTVEVIIDKKYDMDIILLGDLRYINNLTKIDDLLGVYNLSLGTHAYLINRKGAKNLLEQTKNIWTHIDLHIQILHYLGKIKKASLMNRIAFQTSTCGSSSSQTKNTPLLLNKLYKKIELDKMVSLEYVMSVNFFKVYNRNINLNCIFTIVLGYLVGKKFNLTESMLIFFIIYSLDLYNNEIGEFIFHLILFITFRLLSSLRYI